jgi:hypothetical protein
MSDAKPQPSSASNQSPSNPVAPCKPKWDLRAQIVSGKEGNVPNGTKIKISVAERADHRGTTLFNYTQAGNDAKSPVEYLLTGYKDCTYYLSAEALEVPWKSSGDEKIDLKVKDDKTVTITLLPKQIQCIGYYLFTGYSANATYLGIDDPKDFKNSEADAARADMKARCAVMRAAIAEAYETAKVEKDKRNVLKLFMAPEFYFRGSRGAYPLEILFEIMDEMQKETGKDQYEDWLFVFGTALGYLKHGDNVQAKTYSVQIEASKQGNFRGNPDACNTIVQSVSGTDKSVTELLKTIDLKSSARWTLTQQNLKSDIVSVDKTKIVMAPRVDFQAGAAKLVEPVVPSSEIFNVALVRKGGPDFKSNDKNPPLRQVIIYKEYIAQVDFIKKGHASWDKEDGRKINLHGDDNRVVVPVDGSRDLLGKVNKDGVSEVNKSGIGGGSVFTIDDVTYGLEVCLDHDKRRLDNYYKGNKAKKGEPKVQVHLISSGGMDIGTPCCVDDGLVFNVDHEHVRLKNKGGTVAVKQVTLAAIAKAPNDPKFAKLFEEKKQIEKLDGTSNLMDSAQGYIVVFPPQAVPTKATV